MARRITLTLNEDELWLLYQLAVDEISGGPCLIEQPHVEHEAAAGTTLAKLSDAVLDLQESAGHSDSTEPPLHEAMIDAINSNPITRRAFTKLAAAERNRGA